MFGMWNSTLKNKKSAMQIIQTVKSDFCQLEKSPFMWLNLRNRKWMATTNQVSEPELDTIQPDSNEDEEELKMLSFRKRFEGKKVSIQFKPLYGERFTAHNIMLTKHFESQHTGNVYGSHWEHHRFIDDVVIRSFIEGVFLNYLASNIIVKRRLNRIFVAFYVTSDELDTKTLQRIYFLTGFAETMLEKLLSCKTTLELRFSFKPVSN